MTGIFNPPGFQPTLYVPVGQAAKSVEARLREVDTSLVSLVANEILTYTWATMPNFSLIPAGTLVNVSDVGGAGGSLWKSTTVGWVPVNGSVTLASKFGSIASPVASISGSTGALFTIVGGNGSLVLPAKILIPQHSSLRIDALYHRTGATGTAVADIHLGTSGTTADEKVFLLSMAAIALQQVRASPEVIVDTSSRLLTTLWLAPGGASTAPFDDITTNANTDAAMTISFGISSANAATTFQLLGYSVTLNSI